MDEKKTLSGVIATVLTLLFLAMALDWTKYVGITNLPIPDAIFGKLSNGILFVRFFFVVSYGMFVMIMPTKVKFEDANIKYLLVLAMVILGLLVMLGCIRVFVYDALIYPIIFILYIIVTTYAISVLLKKSFLSNSIFGVSQKEADFHFKFPSEEGDLWFHKPNYNFWIEAGAGSGKSETFIKPIIRQSCERGYSMFIYDWEGDPMKEGSPILTQIAYGCYHRFNMQEKNFKFGFINFTDMSKTERVNVFSESYVESSGNPKLYITNIITTLLKNLNPDWKQKMDFWANQAISYVSAIALKCYREREKGVNTLAHVILITLSSMDKVIVWLSSDSEISRDISSIITAYEQQASGQLAGAIASAQTPMKLLNDANIAWVLSGDGNNEFNLDISNKDNPAILCIGNAPSMKEAVSPAISCICSVVMQMMNNPNKENAVFLIDEFPTINLHGIDTFISTARKHNVATILALQDYSQAKAGYGDDPTKTLKGNCGNQCTGSTGNVETAEGLQKLLGEYETVSESRTEQDGGGGSDSESIKEQKVMRTRDIAGQKVGHFIGKVADGNPPYYNLQFGLVECYSQDIPDYKILVKTGDTEKDKKIHKEIVVQNYNRIIEQVDELIAKKVQA